MSATETLIHPDQLAFDGTAAQVAADHGQALALGADRVEQWKATADVWFASLPVGERFTADTLVHECGLPDEGQNRNNVVGAWISAKARVGQCREVGRVKSRRVVGHRRKITLWAKT
jgi:hypothetical protein